MNEEHKQRVAGSLDELDREAAQRLAKEHHEPVAAHLSELRSLISHGPSHATDARASASKLEKRFLAWEAEHPQLVALASRVVRALEDSGL